MYKTACSYAARYLFIMKPHLIRITSTKLLWSLVVVHPDRSQPSMFTNLFTRISGNSALQTLEITNASNQKPSQIARSCRMSSTLDNEPIKAAITRTLQANLQPVHLEVINESHMHNVPAGSETHFKVLVVAEQFRDTSLIKVHNSPIAYENMLTCNNRPYASLNVTETSHHQHTNQRGTEGELRPCSVHRGENAGAMATRPHCRG